MRRIAVVVALLLLAFGCASSRHGDAAGAMRDWMDALNALDEARVVAAFAEDATAFFPVAKAERVDGREAIAAIFHQYFAGSTKTTNIVPEELRVQQSGDIAVITFNVHNPSAVSRRTFIWRRDARGWRIVHMHASNK
ncbi:MAG TPA: nuclear transport factor 2 family protein [Thermoanaerobaculia bacterium]|jgi:ketosteroid isomerase-like protein|nr:nuclear transport factor 2 family protein [Thermoanaerobaculia bacterium]